MLVIGGGFAGMAAALRAAELGADVVLVDDGPQLGGTALAGPDGEAARALGGRVAEAGVEVLAPAAALGFFDGIVPVWCGSTLHQVRAERHVAATGSIEQPLMFEGNDLPGVMLCSGAERLAGLYGVRPGSTAVIATIGDRGLASALALHGAGVEIAAVADSRPDGADEALLAAIREAGIPHLRGRTVARAIGRGQVKGAVLAELDAGGRIVADSERALNCDLIAVFGGLVPATSLLLQAGAKARWDEPGGAYLPEDPPAGIHAAGAVAGHDSAELARASGAIAGAEAAVGLGLGGEDARRRLEDEREALLRAREGWRRADQRPAPRGDRGAGPLGEVLRLPLRGRHQQGHRLRDRRGLRLAGAAEALHDGDDGAVSGADVPARLDPADVRPHRGLRSRGRADDRPPAMVGGADGGSRGPPV